VHRVADVVRSSGARIVSTGGDTTMVAFESASAALAAGIELQQTLAAWLPNMVFLLAGLVLLARVRT